MTNTKNKIKKTRKNFKVNFKFSLDTKVSGSE